MPLSEIIWTTLFIQPNDKICQGFVNKLLFMGPVNESEIMQGHTQNIN